MERDGGTAVGKRQAYGMPAGNAGPEALYLFRQLPARVFTGTLGKH